MTPLERAARGLWEANGSPMKARDAAPAMHPPEDQPDWEWFIPQARAVIAAIREPSALMASRGAEKASTEVEERQWPAEGHCLLDAGVTATWFAMIDALLEEGR